jgi:hypothetical protein
MVRGHPGFHLGAGITGKASPCKGFSVSTPDVLRHPNRNELATTLRHEGIRIGEIIAYRAWRVFGPEWLRRGDDRLHSVLMADYVWQPDEPASGDIRTHGIYSFRDVIKSTDDYGYDTGLRGPILFGEVKIWGRL